MSDDIKNFGTIVVGSVEISADEPAPHSTSAVEIKCDNSHSLERKKRKRSDSDNPLTILDAQDHQDEDDGDTVIVISSSDESSDDDSVVYEYEEFLKERNI